MERYHNITLSEVESLLELKTWWAAILVLPLANRLVKILVNHTRIKPNTITFASLVFRFFSGLFFLCAFSYHMVPASLCYYFAYLLDCVDGPVARLTGQTSEFGRYFDHLGDLVGDLYILSCLGASQKMLFTPMVVSMGIMHLAEAYISYLAGFVLAVKAPCNVSSGSPRYKASVLTYVHQYRHFFFSRNFKSFFSFPDYLFFIFIVFPMAGNPIFGLNAGFCILIVIFLYTVFSTFWAIHSKDLRFP